MSTPIGTMAIAANTFVHLANAIRIIQQVSANGMMALETAIVISNSTPDKFSTPGWDGTRVIVRPVKPTSDKAIGVTNLA
ncbi:hypothetical protein [Rhizobium tibeticum]|uniref:hypothetical protein n=1 Tax=Rhizobium tibeticum TaxID=501024 RepID=UPI0009303002|nr:hypothetical protein [Rhizobium tibeticum]